MSIMSLHYFPLNFFVAISVIHRFRVFIQQSHSSCHSHSHSCSYAYAYQSWALIVAIGGVEPASASGMRVAAQVVVGHQKIVRPVFYSRTHTAQCAVRSAQCAVRTPPAALPLLFRGAAFVPPTPPAQRELFFGKRKATQPRARACTASATCGASVQASM